MSIINYLDNLFLYIGAGLGLFLTFLRIIDYFRPKRAKLRILGGPTFPPNTHHGSAIYLTNIGQRDAVVQPLFCYIKPNGWKTNDEKPKYPQHYLVTLKDEVSISTLVVSSDGSVAKENLKNEYHINKVFLLKTGEVKEIIIRKEASKKTPNHVMTKYRQHLGSYENWEPFTLEFHFRYSDNQEPENYTQKIKIDDKITGEVILGDLGYYEHDW